MMKRKKSAEYVPAVDRVLEDQLAKRAETVMYALLSEIEKSVTEDKNMDTACSCADAYERLCRAEVARRSFK